MILEGSINHWGEANKKIMRMKNRNRTKMKNMKKIIRKRKKIY